MKWKTKGKSAWALFVPDAREYEFLPLVKTLGQTAIEILFGLNFKWQKENFDFINENFGSPGKIDEKGEACDLFIYAKKDLKFSITAQDTKIHIKEHIKKEFPGLKIKLCAYIPVPFSAMGKLKTTAALKELNYPLNSTSGTMKCIFEQLSKKYSRVTVWNLESPVLAPVHFSSVFSNTHKPGVLLTIRSRRDKLVLLSYNSENIEASQAPQLSNHVIPALYDLQSIQNIIVYFNDQNSTLFVKRANELAAVIQSIQRFLP
jgi:hypothetical protein